MARSTLPLMNAPSSARPFLSGHQVEVLGANGVWMVGTVTQAVSMDAPMVILPNGAREDEAETVISADLIGQVEFAEDFDHVKIKGSAVSYSISEIVLLELS